MCVDRAECIERRVAQMLLEQGKLREALEKKASESQP